MAAERIRVLIAGNIYVKRALVRRFLEDDGFEVVGEARNREDMVAAARREQPDALVVDDELLGGGPGGGTMGRVRRAAPDAKVVVFTSVPVDAMPEPLDADGYLEKGLGLASLTALLIRLFAEPAVAPSEAALAETAALAPLVFATAPDDAPASEEPGGDDVVGVGVVAASSAASSRRSGGLLATSAGISRLVAMVAGAVLIVWGLGAIVAGGGNEAPVRSLDTTDQTDRGVVNQPDHDATPLDEAHTTLDEMIAALRSGNYVLATVDAQALMDLRSDARGAGFALTGIDAEVVARLDGVVTQVPTRVAVQLEDILGALYPDTATPTEPETPPDIVLDAAGSAPTSDATTGSTPTTTTSTDDAAGGGTHAPSDDPAPAPAPQAGPQTRAPQPGDGRSWGQSHNPHGGPPGQSGDHGGPTQRQKANHDGGKPPWAGGN
jgi:ActR/RegA family two-component response regulator